VTFGRPSASARRAVLEGFLELLRGRHPDRVWSIVEPRPSPEPGGTVEDGDPPPPDRLSSDGR
jgi:hypothetical protein